MTKNPWMKWYPSDWRGDPLVRACEPITRYVWFEMLGLMHEAEPYGHLNHAGRAMDYKTLSRLIGVEVGVVKRAVKELIDRGVCNRTDDGVLVSRRMIRDQKRREILAENGAKGGKKTQSRSVGPPEQKQGDSMVLLKQPLKQNIKPQKPEAIFQIPEEDEASVVTTAPRDPPRPAAAAPPRSPPPPDLEIQRIEDRCRSALGENAPGEPIRSEIVDLARKVGLEVVVTVLACESRRPRKRRVNGWKLWATIAAEAIAANSSSAPARVVALEPGDEIVEYDYGRRMSSRHLEMVLRRFAENPSSWIPGWGPPPPESPRLRKFAAEHGIDLRCEVAAE